MYTKFNSAENFNELVFENKNKAYGAYAIRKSYKDNVTISLILSSAFFGLLALLAISLTNRNIKIPTFSGNEQGILPFGTVLDIPKPDKLPKTIEKVEAAPKSTSGEMKASDNPVDLLNKTNEQFVINKNPNLNGNDSAAPLDPEIKVPILPIAPLPIVKYVDKMPNLDNMAQFIADHLVYPRVAVENGTSGTVYVTFVVETDGSITDIKLLKGIGDGCEQEAMRVVGIMPLWEPGMDKNIPKRVQCNLPINFRIK